MEIDKTGRNQQRKIEPPAEVISAGISIAEIALSDLAGAAAMRSQLCRTLCPARTMALRNTVAARKDNNAVTGPCTTE